MQSNVQEILSISSQPKLLCLKNKMGIIACRVYDPLLTNFFPRYSHPWKTVKSAFLAEEKMNNLIAFRGKKGASMIGPTDYFCDLERSDLYQYTIDITKNGVPIFKQYPLSKENIDTRVLRPLEKSLVTSVAAQWFSGLNKGMMFKKKQEYQKSNTELFGESLFANPGILEIDCDSDITLPSFDATQFNLSPYKARLVPNHVPFQISSERLNVDDEYCAISYQFNPGYADEQIKNDGGIFLEFHQFSQTITPLEPSASGFVTLAKWDRLHLNLELIAVQIPYGYTLIIDKYCIHGDSTLSGQYLMCMTSDHVSMSSADTVFLKNAKNKENITVKLEENSSHPAPLNESRALEPLVIYKKTKSIDFIRFNQQTRHMKFIFTPFNLVYWEVFIHQYRNEIMLILGIALTIAALFIFKVSIVFGFIALLMGIAFFSFGCYQNTFQSEMNEQNTPISPNLAFS